MSVVPMEKRPPFVRFEEREMGIDAAASETAGRPIPRLVHMACITPAGSKDVFEKIAEEWIAQIRKQALNGQYPLEWVNYFKAAYEEYLKGNELPREGTPVKTWAMLSREAVARLIALRITTVEDLASYPDSGLSEIGLDGRYLRDTAKGWLNEAKDKGINAKALADANAEIERLSQRNGSLEQRMAALEARLMSGPDDDGDEEDDILKPQQANRRGAGRTGKAA